MIGVIAIDWPVGTLAVKLSAGAEDEYPCALAGGASEIRIEAAPPGTSRRRRGVLGPMKPFKTPKLSGGRGCLRNRDCGRGCSGRLDNCHRRSLRKRLISTGGI